MKRKPNLNRLPRKHVSLLLPLAFMFVFVGLNHPAFGQNSEKSAKTYHFSGRIIATNNGISLIPSFSLGEPALMAELSMGGEKFSFDPQFRMSMKGKPWSAIFWFRSHLVNTDNFKFRIGGHPALMFTNSTYSDNGSAIEVIKVSRFLATEFVPTFVLTKHISLTPYTLVAHGFDPGIQNSLYLALISSFSNLKISEHLSTSINPQVFFLKMDESSGTYLTSSFSLRHDKSPVSLEGMFNQKLKSEIESKDFLWSLSLVYTFGNSFKSL